MQEALELEGMDKDKDMVLLEELAGMGTKGMDMDMDTDNVGDGVHEMLKPREQNGLHELH